MTWPSTSQPMKATTKMNAMAGIRRTVRMSAERMHPGCRNRGEAKDAAEDLWRSCGSAQRRGGQGHSLEVDR